MYRKPVVALDLDGTLGDYHLHFTRFAREWTGRPMPEPEDINPGEPFHKHLGLSKDTYRQCKLAYRQGGMKRSMPVYPGASEMIRRFRQAGAGVWICTTRPYLRLDNIDPDTRHWLRRNHIQYDGVLYGHNKYRDLARDVGADDVVAVLDDLVAMLDQASDLGMPAYLRDQPYNRYTHVYSRVTDLRNPSWVDVTLCGIAQKKKELRSE
jgi:phosphoglycolate phosphatase-like HAD superfamily hydrolase